MKAAAAMVSQRDGERSGEEDLGSGEGAGFDGEMDAVLRAGVVGRSERVDLGNGGSSAWRKMGLPEIQLIYGWLG